MAQEYVYVLTSVGKYRHLARKGKEQTERTLCDKRVATTLDDADAFSYRPLHWDCRKEANL